MLKFLIVDDSLGWLNFHKELLEKIFNPEMISITTVNSAQSGYDKILYSIKNPFDIIISDLQMESDFAPMIAGEWLVREILKFPQYKTSQILLISGMYNIEMTAELLGVNCISKRMLVSGSELPLKLKFEEMGYIR